MKWAIVGSRDYPLPSRVREFIDSLVAQPVPEDKQIYGRNRPTIVSGGAKGPDSISVEYAKSLGLPTEVFEAQWNRQPDGSYDRTAGFRRNQLIVDASDVVVAFWDGVSSGTRDTIVRAKKTGKPVIVYGSDGKYRKPPV